MYNTVDEVWEGLKSRFDKNAVKDARFKYVFRILGSGEWTIDINDSSMTIAPGEALGATTTLTIDKADFLQIMNGVVSTQMAYMTGLLKITGDLPAALLLAKFFPKTEKGVGA